MKKCVCNVAGICIALMHKKMAKTKTFEWVRAGCACKNNKRKMAITLTIKSWFEKSQQSAGNLTWCEICKSWERKKQKALLLFQAVGSIDVEIVGICFMHQVDHLYVFVWNFNNKQMSRYIAPTIEVTAMTNPVYQYRHLAQHYESNKTVEGDSKENNFEPLLHTVSIDSFDQWVPVVLKIWQSIQPVHRWKFSILQTNTFF